MNKCPKTFHTVIMRKLLLMLLSVPLFFGLVQASASAQNHCIVQKGDSMWKIALRYNVPFSEILRLNGHYTNPHMIHPMDKILLPHGSTGTQASEGSEYDDISPDDNSIPESDISQQAKAVLSLVNAEREKQGLSSLTLSDKLTAVANEKARDMAENNYFNHTSPTYGSPFQMLQQYGIRYRSAGENIAAGQRTPEEVMQSWMNSSGHRANILNSSYTEIGIGYYAGGSYGTEWVQLFTGK